MGSEEDDYLFEIWLLCHWCKEILENYWVDVSSSDLPTPDTKLICRKCGGETVVTKVEIADITISSQPGRTPQELNEAKAERIAKWKAFVADLRKKYVDYKDPTGSLIKEFACRLFGHRWLILARNQRVFYYDDSELKGSIAKCSRCPAFYDDAGNEPLEGFTPGF